ncbi:MAG: MoaD/ThiS family protein [Proteobacteria bacterium]|nr:MoaD/ThiS family protein [Pseudomonadota bacterium]MDA1355101.1 MoaD/ThiS family protein [Pseudomonadota bacterium]
MSTPSIGHNRPSLIIQTEVRLFNSLAHHNDAPLEPQTLSMAAGSTLGDLLREIALPAGRVHIAMVNGRDVTPDLNGGIEIGHLLKDGDVVALSGPVPYSWGYGSPVV